MAQAKARIWHERLYTLYDYGNHAIVGDGQVTLVRELALPNLHEIEYYTHSSERELFVVIFFARYLKEEYLFPKEVS
jgi:hypothetical protein